MAHTPLADRIKKVKEINEYRKTMTVPEACKKAGVKPFNYANWKKLGIARKAQAPRKNGNGKVSTAEVIRPVPTRSPKAVSLNISGSTDMMFVGFGRSQDVLRALDNLATIFAGQMKTH